MIYLLKGIVAEKSLGRVIIDVNGVGYGVIVPLSTYYRLPEAGSETALKIHTNMKEGSIDLFGFLTDDEKDMFNLLITVKGIGPKGATNILSYISPSELATVVISGELKVKKVPGVGPKTADRITIELKDKVASFQEAPESLSAPGLIKDIISALQNLGYKKGEIDAHIGELEEIASQSGDLETALKDALRIMRTF